MSTYIVYALLALLGLFLAGAAFGLGVWVSHGWLAARADRKLQAEWQRWYSEESKERSQP